MQMPKDKPLIVYEKVCPECHSKEVSFDRRTREHVCEMCGLVFIVRKEEPEDDESSDSEDEFSG
jgi:transcription initiation factor TFIIIB Brf1 subunit/transcription initiation factor TFIIB